MSKKKEKKKVAWQQGIAMVFYMLIGAVCGFFMVMYWDQHGDENQSFLIEMLSLVGLFLTMYIAIFVQVIIHEAGHLIFGLLSGYQFSSFRIFGFMWIQEEGKIKLRRLSIAGTGGQCLMSPPDMVDGKIPVVLYNLGGSIMNVLTGAVFFMLFLVMGRTSFPAVIMIFFAVIGWMFAIMNGIPMRMGTVDNDGYNAWALMRNPEAMRAFWVQLKVVEQQSKGVRLKNMPDEWFTVPEDAAMKNSMVAVMGVFACNRQMDAERFEEADRLMAHMLEIDSGMVGLHRNLMICDRITIELMTENRPNVLNEMLGWEQQKFMKQMKNFPSVLRTEYIYALLYREDAALAEKYKAKFEKVAKTYPYQTDIQSERALMELAEKQ